MNHGDRFPCPNCGETDAWVADYYEAVNQSITLYVGKDGKPEMGDYTGVLDTYDDGSTDEECYRCSSCGQAIERATFVMLDNSDWAWLATLVRDCIAEGHPVLSETEIARAQTVLEKLPTGC